MWRSAESILWDDRCPFQHRSLMQQRRHLHERCTLLTAMVFNLQPKASYRVFRLSRWKGLLHIKTILCLIKSLCSFHGKTISKTKQEKQQRRMQEELEARRAATGEGSANAFARILGSQVAGTPYTVISGKVQPGQSSDPASGFASIDHTRVSHHALHHWLWWSLFTILRAMTCSWVGWQDDSSLMIII